MLMEAARAEMATAQRITTATTGREGALVHAQVIPLVLVVRYQFILFDLLEGFNAELVVRADIADLRNTPLGKKQ